MIRRPISISKLFFVLSLTWLTVTGVYFLIQWKLEQDENFFKDYLFYTPACSIKTYELLNSDRYNHFSYKLKKKICPKPLARISYDGKFIIQNLNDNVIQEEYNICGNWSDTYCIYVAYKRLKYNHYTYGSSKRFYANIRYIPLKPDIEFVKVKCFDSNHHTIYKENLFVVQRHFNKRKDHNKLKSKVSLLIFALDGISKENSKSLLPLTMNFLLSQTKSFEFFGYSNLEDDKLVNVLSILKGPSIFVELLNSTFRNTRYSDFIWKSYNDLGYTTFFAESNAAESLLHRFSYQFRNQSTDLYINPFITDNNENYGKNQLRDLHNNFNEECRARQIFNLMTDFIPHFITEDFFSFSWLSKKQMHDPHTDREIKNLLLTFKNNEILEKTFVFIVSNPPNKNLIHVYNKGNLKEMRISKGQQPILFALLPRNFEMNFPLSSEYFQYNTNRLVTPLDLYATILNILSYNEVDCNQSPKQRNILRQKPMTLLCCVSGLRTCNDLNINQKVCPCDD